MAFFSTIVQSPEDEGNLQRQAQPLGPRLAHQSREGDVRDGHIDVGGKYGDQKDDHAVSSGASKPGQQDSQVSGDFRYAANPHEQLRARQEGGHDAQVGFRTQEVQQSTDDEQRGKCDKAVEEADTTRGRPWVAFFSDHLLSDSLPGENFSTVTFSVATFLRVDWHAVLAARCARSEFCRCLPSGEPRKRDLDVLFCDLLHLGFGHGREVGGLGGGDALVDGGMMGLQIFG